MAKITKFDKLVEMIYCQTLQDSDVLLDVRDCILLLEGIERLRDRFDEKRSNEKLAKELNLTLRELEIRQALRKLADQRIACREDMTKAMHVIQDVAKRSNLPLEALRNGGQRTRRTVIARAEAIRRVHEECPSLSYAAIARVMNIHHTSVLFALGRISGRRSKVPLPHYAMEAAA